MLGWFSKHFFITFITILLLNIEYYHHVGHASFFTRWFFNYNNVIAVEKLSFSSVSFVMIFLPSNIMISYWLRSPLFVRKGFIRFLKFLLVAILYLVMPSNAFSPQRYTFISLFFVKSLVLFRWAFAKLIAQSILCIDWFS